MSNPFHLKYRPRSLKGLIGHETVVAQLHGMLKSGIPNALLITGPSSAGKTTMARAFTCAINGVKDVKELQGAYQEINGADQRTIDDARNLVRTSRFRTPFKRRVIVVDEFQQVVSNNSAAQTYLKQLEEPAAGTLWILCSMEPQKFNSGTGRAIANRCQQLVLDAPTEEDLTKYGMRIIKHEDMPYAKGILPSLVERCNQEFRTLAQLLQACHQWAQSNNTGKLKKHLPDILKSTTTSDEQLVVTIMTSLYAQQYTPIVAALLDVQDHFRLIQAMLWVSQYMLDSAVVKSHRNLKSWSYANREVAKKTSDLKLTLRQLATVNEAMVNLKGESMNFQVDAGSLLCARLYRVIKDLQGLNK